MDRWIFGNFWCSWLSEPGRILAPYRWFYYNLSTILRYPRGKPVLVGLNDIIFLDRGGYYGCRVRMPQKATIAGSGTVPTKAVLIKLDQLKLFRTSNRQIQRALRPRHHRGALNSTDPFKLRSLRKNPFFVRINFLNPIPCTSTCLPLDGMARN